MKSQKLSTTNVGGVVINDAGETVGIVDRIDGTEATILPAALIRTAAKRVLDRQASVPRPWLGIRGETISGLPVEQVLRRGWPTATATTLLERQMGILLTSVVPGSPAALAALRPGDVILQVNNEDVRDAEEFSWLLAQYSQTLPVRFKVARPEKPTPEALEVKLSEAPDPRVKLFDLESTFGFWPGEGNSRQIAPRSVSPALTASLLAGGVETIALRPAAATRFGATRGGLMIVYVQPSTVAFKSGLRSGDVIEAIDGQPVAAVTKMLSFSNPGASYSFSLVRNKEQLVVTVEVPPK